MESDFFQFFFPRQWRAGRGSNQKKLYCVGSCSRGERRKVTISFSEFTDPHKSFIFYNKYGRKPPSFFLNQVLSQSHTRRRRGALISLPVFTMDPSLPSLYLHGPFPSSPHRHFPNTTYLQWWVGTQLGYRQEIPPPKKKEKRKGENHSQDHSPATKWRG